MLTRPTASAMAWLYLAALLAVWLLGAWVAERTTLTLLMAYVPPLYVLWPVPLLLLWALLRRERRAALPLALTLLLSPIYAGYTWHLQAKRNAGFTADTFTLLSYNIARGGYGSADKLAAQILAQRPDLVTLQEANMLRPGERERLLSHFAGYHSASTRSGELLTLSRWPIKSNREIVLPNTTRRFLVTDLGAFSLINVHLSTVLVSGALRGKVPETRDKRAVQVQTLLAEAERLQWNVVLAGDFNTPPRGALYRQLKGQLDDAWEEGGRGTGWSYSSKLPMLRIDHVFAPRNMAVRSAQVLDTGGSDHRGLLVRLGLPVVPTE